MPTPRLYLTITLLGLLAPAAVAAQDPPVDPAELARELPRVAPKDPVEALKTFRLKAGFEIELVAAEPDVVDPVAMSFDADGRMYVVEMRDYPFEPGKGQTPEQNARAKPGRVRLLEDLDGDARVDKSTVFADGFTWPTGIIVSHGGVFLAAAPAIYFLKDETGDGVADRREVVFSGFGTQNVQALLNSFCWGLDNNLWAASGGNGGDIRGVRGVRGVQGDGEPVVSLRGRDFRFRPGSSAERCGPLELVSGGGQFGMCFDDWGERFVCNNSNHLRWVGLEERYAARNPQYSPSRLIADVAEDGAAAPVFRASAAEPWRLVRTRWRAASAERSRFAATELVPIGFFTSATGVHIYRSDAFPPEYHGNAFLGDVGANLIHRKVLTPQGTGFVARRPAGEEASEFLTSSDNWFRPVAFAEGPDGALYVLDMYRETIEHPASIPDSIKKHLDLKSGDDRGRIYRLVPKGFGRPSPPLAPSPPPPARPGLSRASSAELVAALEHPAAWWRETSQRLLVERGAPEAVEPLRRLARESMQPLARAHAFWTLHGLEALSAAEIELALKDPEARVRVTAVRLAEQFLRGAGTPQVLEKVASLAQDTDIRVRRQVALALGGWGEVGLEALARIARSDFADEWSRVSVLTSVVGQEVGILERLAQDTSLTSSQELEDFLGKLGAAVGARDEPAKTERALAILSRLGAGRERWARALFAGTGAGLRRAGKSMATWLESTASDGAEAREGARALLDFAASAAADGQRPESDRRDWIRLLANDRFARITLVLSALLDPREPPAVQLAAIEVLATFPEPGVGKILVERWRSLSPAVRREAAEMLFQRRERTIALVEGLESGAVPPADLDPDRKQRLFTDPDPSLRARAVKIFGSTGLGNRREVVDRFRTAFEGKGEAKRGQMVFERVCATCHRLGNVGHAVAPDLASVRERTAESLLEHILDPNREVAPPYVAYTCVTRDGRVLTGIVAAESGSGITLRRAEGVEETVLRSQIERLESSGQSLMPEGLEKDLTIESLADLIALLLSPRTP